MQPTGIGEGDSSRLVKGALRNAIGSIGLSLSGMTATDFALRLRLPLRPSRVAALRMRDDGGRESMMKVLPLKRTTAIT